jgi:hypothetical protein
MRSSIRLVVSLTLFPIALALCIAILVAPGQPDGWAAACAVLATLTILLGLALAKSHQTPMRAARLAFGAASLLCGVLLLGVPWPPTVSTALSALVLCIGLAGSFTVAFLANRRLRVARWLGSVFGLYGLLILIATVRTAAALPVGAESPAVTISRSLALLLGCCWVVGMWHLRSADRGIRDIIPRESAMKQFNSTIAEPRG